MGYTRKTYKLKWDEGHELHGLEVSLRGMSIGELEEVAALRESVGETSSIGQIKPLMDILGRALIKWNYEDENGVSIAISEFQKQDARMLLAIVGAWTEVVGAVPAPLPRPSSDGKKSEEALIPMEIPSSSHPNLNTQN